MWLARRTPIPDGFEALTAFAIGYAARVRKRSPASDGTRQLRSRKPLGELVFAGGWESPAPWL